MRMEVGLLMSERADWLRERDNFTIVVLGMQEEIDRLSGELEVLRDRAPGGVHNPIVVDDGDDELFDVEENAIPIPVPGPEGRLVLIEEVDNAVAEGDPPPYVR